MAVAISSIDSFIRPRLWVLQYRTVHTKYKILSTQQMDKDIRIKGQALCPLLMPDI
jgi:hypothetical protein